VAKLFDNEVTLASNDKLLHDVQSCFWSNLLRQDWK